jgi:UDPglucose--hexose-1-phosphate uridylyltransferase
MGEQSSDQHIKEKTMHDQPHQRLNPLTGEWVLVSPHRARRPWLGQMEKQSVQELPPYDPSCYLCPGNGRAGGVQNPKYTGPFVFENDFAALLPEADEFPSDPHPLFSSHAEPGVCRVVCFSPRHDLTLPELSSLEIQQVIQTWTEESRELGARGNIGYVQVFENKGAMMGCSNPHPHSQIWATRDVPNEPKKEWRAQREYFEKNGKPLLLAYIQEEERRAERQVIRGEHFSAVVPFWAVWPFEILVCAHRAAANLIDLTAEELASLADVIRQVATRYDNLFEISFPYSMGFHPAPTDGLPHPEWVLHAHFYPPLLRSATVRKFMVGYELLAMPQRDLTPETAAERLRSLPAQHYRKRS